MVWYGVVWYSMVWYGMVQYLKHVISFIVTIIVIDISRVVLVGRQAIVGCRLVTDSAWPILILPQNLDRTVYVQPFLIQPSALSLVSFLWHKDRFFSVNVYFRA
jgi:hypothetical protein